VVALSGMVLLTSATKKTEKPNLVFIFSDQQTFDMLGCYGNKQIKTPILGLMGLEVPTECQGKNLGNAILNHDENAVDYIPIWLYEGKGYRGVITREFTYSTQKDAKEGSLHSVLFDRQNDPYQLTNQFADPKMDLVKEKLWNLTRQWMEKYNDHFWEYTDFMKVATQDQWNNSPYIRPVDILK
jgi:arylsulfatase A-like enzyme